MTSAAELAERATAALEGGDLAAAQHGFARSAAAHAAAGDRAAASIGFRLAGLVAVLAGRAGDAAPLADAAFAHGEDDPRLRFAALVLLAEVHRVAGEGPAAAERLAEAIALVDGQARAGRPVASVLELGALLRRRASVGHALGRNEEAVADLDRAARELGAAGQAASAAATELELFGVLHDASADAAHAALATARSWAVQSGDPSVRAQVDAVAGSAALAAGDLTRARDLLTAARDGALAALDAGTYLAASAGLAMAAEQLGDRQAAYATLTSAWVTIADLLGREVAVAAVRPQLLGLRERWGGPEFAAVKEAHDALRRSAAAAAPGPSVS